MDIFKNKFHNIPAIVVGAGPSLSKSVELLQQAKGEFVIICTYTALHALLRKNIRPDFVIALDSFQGRRETEEQRKERYDIPILYLPSVNNDFLYKFNGEKILCNTTHAQPTYSVLPGEKLKKLSHIHIAGTVSISAMDFAAFTGANPIVLLGQDLSFDKGKTHADGTLYEGQEYKERLFYVKGANGEDLPTNMQMFTYVKSFEEYIRKNNSFTFINATEGGALIKGTKITPLNEVIEEYGKQDRNVENLIGDLLKNSNPIFNERDIVYTLKQMQAQRDLVTQMKNHAKQGLDATYDIENVYKFSEMDKKDYSDTIRKFNILDDKMNKILEQTQIYSLFYDVVQIKLRSHLPYHEKNEQMYFIRHSRILYEHMFNISTNILSYLDALDEEITKYQPEWRTL